MSSIFVRTTATAFALSVLLSSAAWAAHIRAPAFDGHPRPAIAILGPGGHQRGHFAIDGYHRPTTADRGYNAARSR